jgi:hypothetical protein
MGQVGANKVGANEVGANVANDANEENEANDCFKEAICKVKCQLKPSYTAWDCMGLHGIAWDCLHPFHFGKWSRNFHAGRKF